MSSRKNIPSANNIAESPAKKAKQGYPSNLESGAQASPQSTPTKMSGKTPIKAKQVFIDRTAQRFLRSLCRFVDITYPPRDQNTLASKDNPYQRVRPLARFPSEFPDLAAHSWENMVVQRSQESLREVLFTHSLQYLVVNFTCNSTQEMTGRKKASSAGKKVTSEVVKAAVSSDPVKPQRWVPGKGENSNYSSPTTTKNSAERTSTNRIFSGLGLGLLYSKQQNLYCAA